MFPIQEGHAAQEVPVNLYDDGHELVALLPLPGATPDEIEIEVTDQQLVVGARLRGARQEEREYLLHEWRYGSFRRAVTLPFPVDATRANATHGNGVLAVALPKSEQVRTGVIRLRDEGGARHRVQGHAGRDAQPGA